MISINIKDNKNMKTQSKKDKFANLTTIDLIKRRKDSYAIGGLLYGVLFLLFILITSQLINKEVTPFLGLPFALLPILIINHIRLNSINKELKSRGSNL